MNLAHIRDFDQVIHFRKILSGRFARSFNTTRHAYYRDALAYCSADSLEGKIQLNKIGMS